MTTETKIIILDKERKDFSCDKELPKRKLDNQMTNDLMIEFTERDEMQECKKRNTQNL